MQHGDLGFAKHTPAFVLSHGKAWRSMPDLFSCPIITGLPHVTPKPLSLIRYIAEHAGKPNETILDPFMGSGTTLRAAKDLGRKAIGIEIEEKYCEIAARRLQQEVLFTIDHNPSNNNPSNLMLFASNAQHKSYEGKGSPPPIWQLDQAPQV